MTDMIKTGSGFTGLFLVFFGAALMMSVAGEDGAFNVNGYMQATMVLVVGFALMPKSRDHPIIQRLLRPAPKPKKPTRSKPKTERPTRRPEKSVTQIAHQSVPLRLTPTLPLADDATFTSWIGGLPWMPDTKTWPIIDKEPGLFLGQIDCTGLPRKIWNDTAPGNGWFLLFTSVKSPSHIRLIHCTDPGEPRQRSYDPDLTVLGPIGPLRDRYVRSTGEPMSNLPSWPVSVTSDISGQPAPEPVLSGIRAQADMATPAYLPFDWPSAFCLLDAVKSFLQTMMPDPDTADPEQVDLSKRYLAALGHLNALWNELYKASTLVDFSPQMLGLLLRGLSALNYPMPKDMETVQAKMLGEYFDLFELHARHVYTQTPSDLPSGPRSLLEPGWRDAIDRASAAEFDIPTIDADGEPVTTLFLLPSGPVPGWDFGDDQALAIQLANSDLATGSFDAAFGVLVKPAT